jgi:hypothetical protein
VAHRASYPMLTGGGSEVSFLRVKRPRREADDSPVPSVEVKNTWVYTSTAPHTSSLCSACELSTETISSYRIPLHTLQFSTA